jgi:integrase
MPKVEERAPDRLTDKEAAKLAALEAPYGFVCRLALGTGLRWGELCRAQGSDVKRVQAAGTVEDHLTDEAVMREARRIEGRSR